MWLNDEQALAPALRELLQAMTATNVEVVLQIPQSKIVELVDPVRAREWINAYIEPYIRIIRYVCVGHVRGEMQREELSNLWKVMDNIIRALIPISTSIKVSTCVDVSILQDRSNSSYSPTTPPSQFKIQPNVIGPLREIFNHLKVTSTPIFTTIFHYVYIRDREYQTNIGLPNYLLDPTANSYLQDPDGALDYKYVYDAMVDSIYCAMRSWGFGMVPICVLSGWPTAGGDSVHPNAFTIDNARKYQERLALRVRTLRTEVKCNYILSLLDEDTSTGDEESKHLGTFVPLFTPKFP